MDGRGVEAVPGLDASKLVVGIASGLVIGWALDNFVAGIAIGIVLAIALGGLSGRSGPPD